MNLAQPFIGLTGLELFRTRSLAALFKWAMVLACIALAAYWTSRLISPRPVAELPANHEPLRSASAELEMARIFGVSTGSGDAKLDSIALTGVFAPQSGTGGFATFRTAKGGAGVAVGQEIIPGLTLTKVEATQVTVATTAGQRILELPKIRLDSLNQPGATAPAMSPARQGVVNPDGN